MPHNALTRKFDKFKRKRKLLQEPEQKKVEPPRPKHRKPIRTEIPSGPCTTRSGLERFSSRFKDLWA